MSDRAHKTHQTTARELLAANVRRLRAANGWTQDALSHESGLDRSFIAHVEREARNPSLDSIEKLAAAFSVQIGELFSPLPAHEPAQRKRSRAAVKAKPVS